jgi:hypothetical protein
MRCRSVHIGGGEPFLDVDGLVGVIGCGLEMGVGIDYVETNSSWYSGHDEAVSILKRVRDAGLGALLVSISPFHNAFIPFYKVKGVMRAAREVGLQVMPWTREFVEVLERLDERERHGLEEYEEVFGEDFLKNVLRRYWIHPGGRSWQVFERVMKKKPVDLILEMAQPCVELEDVSHFHVDLYGQYVPALCIGINIDAGDLGKPLDDGDYPFVNLLYREGVEGLYRMASEEYGFAAAEEYVSHCQLCHHIRGFLIGEAGVETREFGSVEFYNEARKVRRTR